MTYGHFENGTLVSTSEREHWLLNGQRVQGIPLPDRPPESKWQGDATGGWVHDDAIDAARAAAEQDATERDGIRALLAELRDGTGTNAERIRRLERVAIRLIKDALR